MIICSWKGKKVSLIKFLVACSSASAQIDRNASSNVDQLTLKYMVRIVWLFLLVLLTVTHPLRTHDLCFVRRCAKWDPAQTLTQKSVPDGQKPVLWYYFTQMTQTLKIQEHDIYSFVKVCPRGAAEPETSRQIRRKPKRSCVCYSLVKPPRPLIYLWLMHYAV